MTAKPKVYFIRTDIEAVERDCVGYGWGQLDFSAYSLLARLLSDWVKLDEQVNWQQERQIQAFYQLSAGDLVLATLRDGSDILLATVVGTKSYDVTLADGWAANLVAVDFIKDSHGVFHGSC
ncbi:hypothetical protein ACFBZI_04015 [Moraxella sp. ZJ142]|uniref:hypothetical protein n=1 Tax=Moraxella marmotae TaxID=3344520 RepID=UPI0035D4D13D